MHSFWHFATSMAWLGLLIGAVAGPCQYIFGIDKVPFSQRPMGFLLHETAFRIGAIVVALPIVATYGWLLFGVGWKALLAVLLMQFGFDFVVMLALCAFGIPPRTPVAVFIFQPACLLVLCGADLLYILVLNR